MSHKAKDKFGSAIKENEFIRPNFDSVNYTLNDISKECRKKIFFHSNVDVFQTMISNLQKLRTMNKFF